VQACGNCGAELGGRFCAQCGQRATTRRLELRDVLGQVLESFTLVESPLPATLVGLTRAPGATIARYVEGARVRTTAPLKYALGGMALYVLALRLADLAPLRIQITGTGGSAETAAALARASEAARGAWELATLVALPLVALLQRALFHASGRNYVEGLVFQLYVAGHLHLAGLLLVPLGFLDPQLFLGTRALLALAYVSWASIGFFGARPLSAIPRALAVQVLQWVLVMCALVWIVFPWLGLG